MLNEKNARIDALYDAGLMDMAMPVATHPTYWALALENAADEEFTKTALASLNQYGHDKTNSATPPASSTNGDSQSWGSSPGRACMNCHITQTPFWRRAEEGFFCNACGLYLRAHKKMRPVTLQINRSVKRLKTRADVCSNCQTTETPLWRRIASGETVCNACGLYFKLHGLHRMIEPVKGGTSMSRGLGKKPRALLPKYTVGSAWHQYYPPVLPRSAQGLHTDTPAQLPQLAFYNEGSNQENSALMDMNYVQYAMMHCGGNNLASPALLPYGYMLEHGSAGNQRRDPNIEGSLDDSMRWFSSTCLETAFTPE